MTIYCEFTHTRHHTIFKTDRYRTNFFIYNTIQRIMYDTLNDKSDFNCSQLVFKKRLSTSYCSFDLLYSYTLYFLQQNFTVNFVKKDAYP